MMDVPENLKLKHVLVQGGAFKASFPGDSYPRYYFVLNQNPATDTLIILSTSTTQFTEHRNCPGGDDVHIPLGREDYPDFTQNCLICCNRPRTINKKELEKQLASQKYVILPPLKEAILSQILSGIAKSKVIEPNIKKLILGEPE
jgi:hypothetical protein